jgi:hypothetical protein
VHRHAVAARLIAELAFRFICKDLKFEHWGALMGWIASFFSSIKAEVEWLITSLAVASGTETAVSGDTQQANGGNTSHHNSDSAPDTHITIPSLMDQQADSGTADHSGTQHVTSDAVLIPGIDVQVADVATGHPANLLLNPDFLIDTAIYHQIAQDGDTQNAGSDPQPADTLTQSPLLLNADVLIDTADHSGPAPSPGLTPASFESGASGLSGISAIVGAPAEQNSQVTLPETVIHPAISTPNPDAGQFAFASLGQQVYGFAQGGSGGSGTSNSGGYSHHDITSAGTGNTIVLHLDNSLYDLSRTNAPLYAAISGDLQKAVDFISNNFNNKTIDGATDPTNSVQMNVGWGEVSGTAITSGLGDSHGFLYAVNYSDLQTAFTNASNAETGYQSQAVTIPSSEPFSSSNPVFEITSQQIHVLGITSLIGTGLHYGGIGFSNASGTGNYGTQFFFNPGNPVAGAYDFTGIALHEITEQLGRLTSNSESSTPPQLTLPDLFRFSDGNAGEPVAGTPISSGAGYFSVDNGTTNLVEFNSSSIGDAGDWATTTDAFAASPAAGAALPFTYTDYLAMEAVGLVGTFNATGTWTNWG